VGREIPHAASTFLNHCLSRPTMGRPKALSTHSNDVRLLRIQAGGSPWQINLELSSPTSTV